MRSDQTAVKPERIAMVGAGYFAQFQIGGWRDAGFPVIALCDLDMARASELAQRMDVGAAYDNAEAMFDAVKPTLVDVVLPSAAQAPVVRAALARRIPVICQKPFGNDWIQAVALTEFAEEQQTALVVHENFRFAPWFRECRRLIDADALGRMHGIAFRLRPGDGQGSQAYLDRQPYFQQMPQFLVRETAVHFIDTFRFLLGEVQAVTARLRRLNPHIAGEDAGLIIFEFADSATGLFDGNRLNDHVALSTRRTMGEMWLEGEKGVLRLDGDARLWWKPHHGSEAAHPYEAGDAGAFGGACTRLQAHVLSHLRTGTPLENAARDYLPNLRVQAAIYASHVSGQRVTLANFTPETSITT
ncbi:MAG: Gfo/Idh/MocA family oxidoreductase [Gammaproteobacteria bacterium]|nr:Gfo/Idh/MocA family oxidoreductase [Gammaproteobacteria bacterium]MBU1443854.1 Gfo/Idh/MocA family oxidoreductase [Gammaproteobacteria bacterium]MBU2287325.1 Gfo/Idh/MocA family oxidoreductase [Gammaproteobacteria bacterium]MBU2409212.1 Gfo/Idh/MocA family oxidoreductase [Gammaproteobacteria bacterium]